MVDASEKVSDKGLSVSVNVEDINYIIDALSNLEAFCITQDLTRQYQNLSSRMNMSKLTKMAQEARNRVIKYGVNSGD